MLLGMVMIIPPSPSHPSDHTIYVHYFRYNPGRSQRAFNHSCADAVSARASCNSVLGIAVLGHRREDSWRLRGQWRRIGGRSWCRSAFVRGTCRCQRSTVLFCVRRTYSFIARLSDPASLALSTDLAYTGIHVCILQMNL